MQKRKLSSKKIFDLKARFWFWTFWAGVFFGLGYSITNNIFLSSSVSDQSNKQNLHRLKSNKPFPNLQNSSSKGNRHAINNSNSNQTQPKKKLKKIIVLPTSDNSDIKISIPYSEIQNPKKQAVFKNNRSFFEKENVESLMKSLTNPKKTKSSKMKSE